MNFKTLIFLFLIGLLVFSYFQKEKISDNQVAVKELYREPIQEKINMEPFKIIKEGIVYKIEPLYKYELYGMIVSYNLSKNWFDYYHKEWNDFINIKDICVIWGDNVKNKIYESVKFKSGSWTCYAEGSNKAWSEFRNNALSNNHLLSDNEEINSKIMEAEKGDQVYFKGYLVQYSHSNGSFSRGTSISREDSGNGACETIYVTDFEIIKKANRQWHFLYFLSKYSIIFYIILYFIYIFFWPTKELKSLVKRNRE